MSLAPSRHSALAAQPRDLSDLGWAVGRVVLVTEKVPPWVSCHPPFPLLGRGPQGQLLHAGPAQRGVLAWSRRPTKPGTGSAEPDSGLPRWLKAVQAGLGLLGCACVSGLKHVQPEALAWIS